MSSAVFERSGADGQTPKRFRSDRRGRARREAQPGGNPAGDRWFVRPPAWCRDPIRVGRKATPRTLLVTGATGFVGRHLCRRLIGAGDHLIVLSRDSDHAWDLYGPHAQIVTSLDAISSSQRIDAVINLAGARILASPWTAARRAELLESRLRVTNGLVALIARLETKPAVLLSASAIGYYGVRDDAEITEASRGQPIFQSHLCQNWELAAQAAEQYGVRVCRLRFGLVFGSDGGALPELARPARLCMQLTLGTGSQWVSWIHVEDLVDLMGFCLERGEMRGGINATAPEPVRQRELAALISRQFGRALPVRVPAWTLRAALGEMSQLLIEGQRVLPTVALCHGFRFRHADAAAALHDLLSYEARNTAPMQIMYDTDCPVCDMEMNRYQREARRCGMQWRFCDVADRPELMLRYRLDTPTARKRVYVLDDAGRMVSGLPAIALIWSSLPRWRVLARIAQAPVFREIGAALYDFVLAAIIWRWNERRRGRVVSW